MKARVDLYVRMDMLDRWMESETPEIRDIHLEFYGGQQIGNEYCINLLLDPNDVERFISLVKPLSLVTQVIAIDKLYPDEEKGELP